MQEKYDVIVIGAGLGGLCAAFEAFRRGKNVLLVEQHNLPGGFATSFTRGRFEFETSLHELAGFRSDPEKDSALRYLKEDAELDIEFLPVPEAYRLILTDKGIDAALPFGVEEFIGAIEELVPGSRPAVRSYMDLCREVQESFLYLSRNRNSLNYRDFIKNHKQFISFGPATMDEAAERLNLPEQVREILYPYWCYLGVPSDRSSFPIWASLLSAYISTGAAIPKMRSHEIAAAFTEKIRESGGETLFNTRVEKILVRRGRAAGIETASGRRFDADAIITNASPTQVFNSLVHPRTEVPAEARQNIRSRKHGFSMFVVYLGLDRSPEELGLKEYSYFIAPHMETDRLYRGTFDLESDEILQAAVCLNAANPDCSPPGTTILSLTAGYRAEAWEQVREEDYFRTKNRIAGKLIRQFEQATGTKIQNSIEEIEVATPQTFARYTDTYNGVVYGYEPEPWDSVIPRAVSEKRETYIQGLQFCGGFSSRCHGYGSSILSGRAAAERTLNLREGQP